MNYFVFSVIILLMVAKVNSNTCLDPTDENSCPTHRPFCTSVGCVSSCDKPLYINGSNCILHCGESFVSGRTCIPSCSEDQLIRETLKVIGDELYMEKACVSACYYRENIYNRSCERACPSTANFIVDRKCSQRCPADQPYVQNYTNEGLLQHQCKKMCWELSEDKFCTSSCSSGKVIFNSTCMFNCPASHAFILGRQCVETCPNTTVHVENKTCLSYCPRSLPFVYNGSCVMSCPNNSMFHNFLNNLTFCVDKCDKYISNKTCVDRCPSSNVISNRRCLPECPSDFPFVTNVTEKYDCKSSYCKTVKWYMHCTEKCPLDTFMYGRNCVRVCPNTMVNLNGMCVKDCNGLNPYTETSAIDLNTWTYSERQIGWRRKESFWKKTKTSVIITHCVNNCSAGKFLMNNSSACLDKCPDGHRVLNNNCVSECPESYRYEINTTSIHYLNCTVKDYLWRLCNMPTLFMACIENCPKGTIIHKNQCWYACPESMVMLNNDTCLPECPESHPYHLKMDIPVPFPSHHHIMVKNGNDLAIVAPTTACLSRCPQGYLHDKSRMECIKMCPYNSSHVHDDTCMTACPEGLVKNKTGTGTQCLQQCPAETVLNQNLSACMKSCPANAKYIHESVCLDMCPSSHPFGIKADDFWKTRRYICVDSCEDDYVYKDDDCISSYSCKEPEIIFAGQCLLECPPGYLWFMTCFHRLGAIIAIPCVCILFFVAICHVRLFLKDAYQVLELSLMSRNPSASQLNAGRQEELERESDDAVAVPEDIDIGLCIHNRGFVNANFVTENETGQNDHNHDILNDKNVQMNDKDIGLEGHSRDVLISKNAQSNDRDILLGEYNHGYFTGKNAQGNKTDTVLEEHNHNFLVGNNTQGDDTNIVSFVYNQEFVNDNGFAKSKSTGNDTGADLKEDNQSLSDVNMATANSLCVSTQAVMNDENEKSIEETVV